MLSRHGYARVRIFLDFWNFALNWKSISDTPPEKNLKWSDFPSVIIEQLDEILPLRGIKKELRAIKVYTSVKPAGFSLTDGVSSLEVEDEIRRDNWFRNNLDQLTGYTVDITTQSHRQITCNLCNKDTGIYKEQGVDTKMAIDLVALASRDLFDIAVVITDDTDLIPSIQCVQDALDKQVVHLGFDLRMRNNPEKRIRNDVRNEAWGHLIINDMLSSIA